MSVQLLDYPRTDIRMHVETTVEKEKRIVACRKETETVDWMHSLPTGSVLFDVGANVGSYSLIASFLGHRVVAFEPSAPNYAQLVRNLALNPELSVTALPYLLSYCSGLTFFKYSSLDSGAALHNAESGVYTQTQIAWALDDLMSNPDLGMPQPDYLKIDVDGGESAVLQGAFNTLRSVKGLLVEIDDSCTASETIEGTLDLWGFKVKSRHRHGSGPVSNVVFTR